VHRLSITDREQSELSHPRGGSGLSVGGGESETAWVLLAMGVISVCLQAGGGVSGQSDAWSSRRRASTGRRSRDGGQDMSRRKRLWWPNRQIDGGHRTMRFWGRGLGGSSAGVVLAPLAVW
jgi:hypothetical protein